MNSTDGRNRAWRRAQVTVLAVLVILFGIGAGNAGTALIYPTSQQTLNVTTANHAIIFATGADSGPNRHVTDFAILSNGARFDATLHGVPAATVIVPELFQLTNQDTVAREAVLSGNPVTNVDVVTLTFEILDGATSLGTLDMKATDPRLDLGSVPAGDAYSGKLTLRLAEGADQTTVNESITIHRGERQ